MLLKIFRRKTIYTHHRVLYKSISNNSSQNSLSKTKNIYFTNFFFTANWVHYQKNWLWLGSKIYKITTCFIGKLEALYHLPDLYRQWTKLIMIIVQQMSSLGRICLKSAGRHFTRKLKKKNPLKINIVNCGSCFRLVPSYLWNWQSWKKCISPLFSFLVLSYNKSNSNIIYK